MAEISNPNATSDVNAHNAPPPFDNRTFELIEIIVRLFITGCVSIFGLVSNATNLIVFYRQGPLSHSCTVSLLGLAVSDFCFCVLVFWGSVCLWLEYYVDQSLYKWHALDFFTFTSVRPAAVFSDITCWVTAFVTFERLFSVTFPFKVKTVFTPKRTCAIIVCIAILIFIIHITNITEYTPRWVQLDAPSNFTIMKYEIDPFLPDAVGNASNYTRFILRIAVIVIVLLCNVTISWKVNFSQKFRKSTASTAIAHTVSPSSHDLNSSTQNGKKQGNSDTGYNSSKEMKLVRMITVVCILFSVCYMMEFLHISMFYISGWEPGIDYHWMSDYTLSMVNSFLLTINSSSNIIVYHTMSTRYREELRLWLCGKKP